ncbi:MAG: DUF4087 domain-containing protein, partial [Deltaproteobacteria bacterium]|nr:DUF4087 domain-containing protein [Deltaproteobacteria bacterium]
PELKRGARYWKETNGHYGYGCACLSVITDEKEGRIIKIKGGRGLLLSQCQADKSLRVRH